MPQLLVESLTRQGLTVSTAESCTAGQVAAEIGAIPGASQVLKGGHICYSNEMKTLWTDVDIATLDAHGAVSEQVVMTMADRVRAQSDCDMSVAISGIMGPTGQTETKPIGTTWFAISLAELDKMFMRGK